MRTNVKQNDLAYIVSPAYEGARGHFVEVLRRAVGDQDLDGADFQLDDLDIGRAIWIVRGNQVPWGDGSVNVFSISDICLRPIIGRRVDTQQNSVPVMVGKQYEIF